jgi:hypothetical protein
MNPLTATTELNAVNTMLSVIGESPINDLTADQSMVDVATARAILREVFIQVQEEGWDFNTEVAWALTPTVANEIYLPANCLQVDVTTETSGVSVVARGNRLYDKIGHSFSFTSKVIVDMVVLLDFDQVPEACRHYTTIRAARVFQQRSLGSETLAGFTEKDEARARAALKKLDANTADYNILSGSWSVARILNR